MTTYTWPDTDSAFRLAQLTFKPRHNARFNTSELNGAGQGISLPGARWGLVCDFPKQTYAERARVEAFFNRLSGYEHRAQLWDVARSAPSLLSGSPLVNGTLAQFAQTLSLDGVIRAGSNLLRLTQDFTSTVWAKVGATVTADAETAPDGTTTADLLVESTAVGAHQVAQVVTGQAAGTYTFAVYVSKTFVGTRNVAVYPINSSSVGGTATRGVVFDQAGAFVSFVGVGANPSWSVQDVGTAWRLVVTGTTTATGAVAPTVQLINAGSGSYTGDGTSGAYVWGASLNAGPQAIDYTLPSLTPGDWLRLPLTAGGSQLVQVVNTTLGETLTGVEFRPSLRGAVADNAAITIVQPSALYRLADPNALEFPRGGGGMCPPMSIELVEEFT